MEISITSVLLLVVILFTGHCFGIKCYSCSNDPTYLAHDDLDACGLGFVTSEVECTGGREDRTFCLIEEDLDHVIHHLGCFRRAEVLPRNPYYCEHHSHRDILPIPPSIGMNNTRPPDIITQYKFCLCSKSLCNKYPPPAESFTCLACNYPRYPFNHDCSPNETPQPTRCQLDEYRCGYETYPKRKIGCVVPFAHRPQHRYNIKEVPGSGSFSFCLANGERTGCYCNTTNCNDDSLFVEPPLTTTTTKSTGETKSFSMAITLLFTSIALVQDVPRP